VTEVSFPTFSIGGRPVGRDHRPYVVAEAGVHHYNSVELAEQYIERAKAAGADAIKFQTYEAARLVTRWAQPYWDAGGKTQFDIFAERSLLSEGEYARLFSKADEIGIQLLSTPFDPGSAQMLDALGMAAVKIASGDLTYFPLLETVAGMQKPVLLSTGASTLDEIAQAVRVLRDSGARDVALLHCSLAYPTKLRDANLLRIDALQEAFPDCVIGYSDHTVPTESELPCPLAVCRGAAIVEKHFSLDTSLPGDDHYHSVDPPGLARLVKQCGDAWTATGHFVELTAAEMAARDGARRSIVAARTIPCGKPLQMEDVDFKRPGIGIPPSSVDRVVGRRTTRGFSPDELIEDDGLEPL
jgi:sialic acid synthase SpsE